MRAEGFSCTLDVLYGGLGISKIEIFDHKKIIKKFSAVNFSNFGSSKPLDPDWYST